MRVTDEAAGLINVALKKINKDYCHIGLVPRCHGNMSLDMHLISKNEVINLIDLGNIVVDMNQDVSEFFKDFVMEKEGQGLKLTPPDGWHPAHECCGGHKCHDENGDCGSGEECRCDK